MLTKGQLPYVAQGNIRVITDNIFIGNHSMSISV